MQYPNLKIAYILLNGFPFALYDSFNPSSSLLGKLNTWNRAIN